MRAAYIDTSCLVAIAFDEPGARSLATKLARFDRWVSSNLLEAELRATFTREGLGDGDAQAFLADIDWVLPNRRLGAEIGRVLGASAVRGADLWHLACALFVAPEASDLAFLSLDAAQSRAAARLGFSVL